MVWFKMSYFKKELEPLLPIELRTLNAEGINFFSELPHHYDGSDEKIWWKPNMLEMKMAVSAALVRTSTAVLKWLQG